MFVLFHRYYIKKKVSFNHDRMLSALDINFNVSSSASNNVKIYNLGHRPVERIEINDVKSIKR